MSPVFRTLAAVCSTALITVVTVGVPASPAWANTPCFTVTDNVVSDGASCTGVVTLPVGVTSIADNAFRLSGLTSIVIPKSVTSIGNDAFGRTFALTSVTFEAGSELQTIGDGAFSSSGYTSIEIPKSVTSIGDYAFGGTSALTSVTFEAGSELQTIGDGAFSSSGLTSIVIPKSVTSIGEEAFDSASSLASVTFETGSLLETIGDYAFYQASSLTSIVFPNSVTSIGFAAFQNSALMSVTFQGDAPTVGDWAFNGLPSGATANISSTASGFPATGTWNGLIVVRASAPLTPAFDAPVRTADGFTVNVTNYDAAFTWAVDPSGAALDGATATLSVTGAASGVGVTVTVTTQRDGYDSGTAQVTGAALEGALTPEFGTPVRTADGFTVNVTNYDAAFTWAVDGSGAALDGATATLSVTGAASGVEVTVTVTTQRDGYDSGSAQVTGAADDAADDVPGDGVLVLPSVTCSPLPVQVGALVTCTVAGGDAGSEILWRAAYNPAFAGEGVTLDASGSGEFSFVVPAAALGEVLTVELVGWTAPVSLGTSGGPVPTSVPSGGGPVPVWTLALAALAGVGLLRRGMRAEA